MSYTARQALISQRKYEVYKTSNANKCIKIFRFSKDQSAKYVLIKNHFEGVKQWLQLRYSSKSILRSFHHIAIQQLDHKQTKILKVQTNLFLFPNLALYYYKLQSRDISQKQKQSIPQTFDAYMYYFKELFQIILRGGTIMNYFYTPNNIYFNRPPPRPGIEEVGTFHLNFASTVGLDLVLLQKDISIEELQEIFPLLPCNLNRLEIKNGQNKPDMSLKQLNKIIKMKAFAWNILCFILKEVPNVLIEEQQLPFMVSFSKVAQLTKKHKKIKTINKLYTAICEQKIKNAFKTTEIKFISLFDEIFLKDCQSISWDTIYETLFLKNKKHLEDQKMAATSPKPKDSDLISTQDDQKKSTQSELILRALWKQQPSNIIKFYEDRSIPGGSIPYLLIKVNAKFSRMMMHINLFTLIEETKFTPESMQLHLVFMDAAAKKGNKKGRKRRIPMPYNSSSRQLSAVNVSQHLVRQYYEESSRIVVTHPIFQTFRAIQNSFVYQ